MGITQFDIPGYHEYQRGTLPTGKKITVDVPRLPPKIATKKELQPAPVISPFIKNVAVDIAFSTLGPIGTLAGGLLNRDRPPGEQTPMGQFGEILWQFNPVYQGWSLFVDKPEGGIIAAAATGGAGIIPGFPTPQGGDGGILGDIFGGDTIFNLPGGGGGGGFFGLPSFDDLKMPLLMIGGAIAGIYLLGKAIK